MSAHRLPFRLRYRSRHRSTPPGRRTAAAGSAVLVAAVLAAVAAAPPPAGATGGFVSDGFDGASLGSHWELVRPLGVGSAEVAGGRLGLSVPAGASHDPWTSLDAVRVVQPVADGDLSVEARFESVPVTGYQMQGLVAAQAPDTFVRFEVHHTGTQLRLFASTTAGGAPATRVNQLLPAGLSEVFLRLVRSGDEWQVWWSADGAAWSSGGSFTQVLSVARVGPFVGNYAASGDAPAFTALVDYVTGTTAGDPPDDPPADPPVVSGVQATVQGTTVDVSWSTDVSTTGVVEYGTTTSYGSSSSLTTLGTQHQVTLTGLDPDTTYHYRVVATGESGSSTTTTDRTFTTGPEPDPDPEPDPGGFVSDEFDGSSLGSHWEVARPLGVGSVGVAAGRLELSVPAGVSHDPWTSNDAVRVVQPVADSDLSIEARFESIPVAPYQMQGLVVEQADDAFVRYEVHHDGSQLRLFASTTVGGAPQVRVSQALPALAQVYLRLVRSGDDWQLWWSADGASWSVGGSFTHAMAVSRVGPFVGNYHSSGAAPAYTAQVDYVAATEPGTPVEDPDDQTPPQVSGVTADVSDTTAQVSWTTDELSTGQVEYGTSPVYGSSSGTTAAGTAHQVTLAGLLADTTYHYRVVATDASDNTTITGDGTFHTAAHNPGPDIDVWYGPEQAFGPPALGQTWVNVLGNVADPDGVGSLSYSLNDGPERALTIGPDQRRLQWPGDFNVDIPFAGLNPGANSVTLTAVDGRGAVTVETVTVQRLSGSGADLPYQLAWDAGTPVAEQAQVADGKWTVTGTGVRTAITGYDRLITIGDVSWSDYQLTVPVTVHELGPAAYSVLSGAPLIGVGLRWNGHTVVDSAQPAWGWYPTGAFAWFRYFENGGRIVLTGNDGNPVQYAHPAFPMGSTYLLKVRVETLTPEVTRYQTKLWPQGDPEPASWLASIDVTGGPASGSILLIAHQLDGTFGDVTVEAL